VVNLFDRLNKRLAPAETAEKRQHDLELGQLLLNWLQVWKQKTVTERQIRIFGPGQLRDRERVNRATEILIKNGWLHPPKITPRGAREWKLVHKMVVAPRVAEGSGAVTADVAT
jgi:hypothetical protein